MPRISSLIAPRKEDEEMKERGMQSPSMHMRWRLSLYILNLARNSGIHLQEKVYIKFGEQLRHSFGGEGMHLVWNMI